MGEVSTVLRGCWFCLGRQMDGSPDAIIFSMLQLGKAVDTQKALIKSGLLFLAEFGIMTA